jgi:hypothetical protein
MPCALADTPLCHRDVLSRTHLQTCNNVCPRLQSDLSAATVDIQALEQNLGSALLKLQYIDQLVKPLPPGALQLARWNAHMPAEHVDMA